MMTAYEGLHSSSSNSTSSKPTIMSLQCIVQGDSSPFPVHIIFGNILNPTIGDLKEKIKDKIKYDYPTVDAKNLVLWKTDIIDQEGIEAFIPQKDIPLGTYKLRSTAKIAEVFNDTIEDGHIYVVIESPLEQESSNKRRRLNDGWQSYTAFDEKSVELPTEIIAMLNSQEFVPEPRANFLAVLRNAQAGQPIILPSLGQNPKYFGTGYQKKTIFVTEQMIEMWQMLSKDQVEPCSIKRVLSGPMGVGKSYLALYLAAKAYSEGWPMLYIADAASIIKDSREDVSEDICKRFFAINKDILTAAELTKLVRRADSKPAEVTCASIIFSDLLQQNNRKTLLVVDEHGILFKDTPAVPQRLPILAPLMYLTSWREEVGGARVIFTGTAHAKFERQYLDNDNLLEFVGPLSDGIFNMLLNIHPFFKKSTIAPKVKKIVNSVPRELMYLDKHVKDSNGNYIPEGTIDDALKIFRKVRADALLRTARNYFDSLSDGEKMDYRKALSNMFLRWSDISTNISFDWKFLDTGLVYRLKDSYGYVKYKFLCPAALDALLEVYTMFPLPRDVSLISLKEGQLTGNNFEEILFQQLVKYRDIPFQATNLNGAPTADVYIKFQHFINLEKDQFAPGKEHAESLVRGYSGYPRFDFMLGPIFIQVSISAFDVHNQGYASIDKAFNRPYYSDDVANRNQIEVYLDKVFGSRHQAEISHGRFIVTKDDQLVKNFRIVYIRGSPGAPNHSRLVNKYQDLAFINYEELKNKLFGDFR